MQITHVEDKPEKTKEELKKSQWCESINVFWDYENEKIQEFNLKGEWKAKRKIKLGFTI